MRWPNWQQKERIFRAVNYVPLSSQLPVHQSLARVLLIAGGERSGKSKSAAAEITARSFWCSRAGRVAIVAQEYDESRSECGYLLDDFARLGVLQGRPSTPRVGKWQWNILGPSGNVAFETISLAQSGVRELTGRGLAFDIVLLCEAGLVPYDAFTGSIGRVSETAGLVILSGTLWDSYGWLAQLYESFAGTNVYGGEVFALPTWDNIIRFPGGKGNPEIQKLKAVLTEDEFARRVAAKIIASPAKIFPEFDFKKHVTEDATFDTDYPVHLAVDAGYYPSHYAVLALQTKKESVKVDSGVAVLETVRQIDELWEHHLTHHDVIDMCRQRKWWSNVEDVVGGHETKQHQAAKSTEEVWNELVGKEDDDPKSYRFHVFDAGRVLDGVIRVKTFLKDPGTNVSRYYCNPNSTGTQQEFQAYKRKTDTKGNVRSEQPEDKNNDAMDALRNYLVWRFGHVERRGRKPKKGKPRARTRG